MKVSVWLAVVMLFPSVLFAPPAPAPKTASLPIRKTAKQPDKATMEAFAKLGGQYRQLVGLEDGAEEYKTALRISCRRWSTA